MAVISNDQLRGNTSSANIQNTNRSYEDQLAAVKAMPAHDPLVESRVMVHRIIDPVPFGTHSRRHVDPTELVLVQFGSFGVSNESKIT